MSGRISGEHLRAWLQRLEDRIAALEARQTPLSVIGTTYGFADTKPFPNRAQPTVADLDRRQEAARGVGETDPSHSETEAKARP